MSSHIDTGLFFFLIVRIQQTSFFWNMGASTEFRINFTQTQANFQLLTVVMTGQ